VSQKKKSPANPGVIVLAWLQRCDRANPAKTFAVEKWRNVSAIQNRRVFIVRDELLNTPAPILTHGARELVRILTNAGTNGEETMRVVVAAVIERGRPPHPHRPAPKADLPPSMGISRGKMEEGETPEHRFARELAKNCVPP